MMRTLSLKRKRDQKESQFPCKTYSTAQTKLKMSEEDLGSMSSYI